MSILLIGVVILSFFNFFRPEVEKEPSVLNVDKAMESLVIVKHPMGGYGTGFVISEDGLMVTNNHVAEKFSQYGMDLRVSFKDGRKYTAKIIATKPSDDLAIARINSTDKFSALDLDDETLHKHQIYTLIGHGNLKYWKVKKIAYKSYDYFRKWELEFSPGIQPGDSGGPVLDDEGDVVGVGSAMSLDDKDSLVVPVKDIKDLLKESGIEYE